MTTLQNVPIFILSGGLGTRLREAVPDKPKGLAPVGNRPFLDHQIAYLNRIFPASPIYLLAHHLAEQLTDAYAGTPSVQVIREPRLLGTGGAIKNALREVGWRGPFLAVNGDTYVEADLQIFLAESNHDVNLLVSFQKECARYGTLKIEGDHVLRFEEKIAGSRNGYINAGYYYFSNGHFFDRINRETFSLELELSDYLASGHTIGAYRYNGVFIDIGVPEDYLKMNRYIAEKNG